MRMQMILSEEKANDNHIDLEECYAKVDRYYAKRHISKVAKGIYEGTKNDFATFMGALINLPQSKWFLKVVEEWYFWFEGDGPEYKEDALESHYRIKAIADEYRKSQGIKLRS